MFVLNWTDVHRHVDRMAMQWEGKGIRGVFGIPTGGSFVAVMLSRKLDVPILEKPERDCLVVDDLIESGRTMEPYIFTCGFYCDALFRKPHSPWNLPSTETVDDWIAFPWEHEQAPYDAAIRLLQFMKVEQSEIPGRAKNLLDNLTLKIGRAALLEIADENRSTS